MELKKKYHTLRMLVKGGIITPAYFLKILEIARTAGNTTISFGSRQDIIFKLPVELQPQVTAELDKLKIEYAYKQQEIGTMPQNIVSSFVAADIQGSTQWLNSGNYIQILDLFEHKHKLRVNIADPRQTMVPLFYGHINFVASPSKHYWYVYLRLPEAYELYQLPFLIYSTDIPALAHNIEKLWDTIHTLSAAEIGAEVGADKALNTKSIDTQLEHPKTFSADYEGFGRMYESDKYWAGFYWRNNQYEIRFLEQMCRLSLDTGLAKIAITPWKSFLVKSIEEKHLMKWQTLLGKNGITMRHSAFDLNWHLPLDNKKALKLKNHIVRKFDKQDVCVHGLTFSIMDEPELQFSSIVIKEHKPSYIPGFMHFLKTYDISYAERFDPNSCIYHYFVEKCTRNELDVVLSDLIRRFHSQILPEKEVPEIRKNEQTNIKTYQCPDCFSVYLQEIGCPEQHIAPGTPFAKLPESYCCPVCETAKSAFVVTDKVFKNVG
ncbi:MAG: hypothetical protein RIS29_1510 [Bacteroidota bacterium]